jgi:enterochelin esterase family protein
MHTRVGVWLLLSAAAVAAQQAHVNLDWNPQKNTRNLIPFGANAISPEVRDDGTVIFRLKAPEAQRVALAGGPLLLALKAAKPIAFTKGEDGTWTLTAGPIAPYVRV